MSTLLPGTPVTANVNGRTLRGYILGTDATHYHATVNGHTVYNVQWDEIGFGGGWLRSDLTPGAVHQHPGNRSAGKNYRGGMGGPTY